MIDFNDINIEEEAPRHNSLRSVMEYITSSNKRTCVIVDKSDKHKVIKSFTHLGNSKIYKIREHPDYKNKIYVDITPMKSHRKHEYVYKVNSWNLYSMEEIRDYSKIIDTTQDYKEFNIKKKK